MEETKPLSEHLSHFVRTSGDTVTLTRDTLVSFRDMSEKLEARIRELEEERRWISVEERLPELGQVVALVHVDRWWATGRDEGVNCYDVGYLNEFGEKYWSIRGERASMVSAYTHWMPLPTPPSK